MKLLRTIGLAVFAAMALIAVAGAGTATADTTLCKSAAASPYCPNVDRYPAKTAFEAKAQANVVIDMQKEFGFSVECKESTLKGETGAASGSPLAVTLTAWTLAKCGAAGSNNCTASTVQLGKASLLWSKGSSGTLGVVGQSWYLKCTIFGFVVTDCTLALKDAQITVNGGAPASISIASGSFSSVSGSFCPEETTTLKAVSYGVSTPSAMYVANTGGTQLCSAYWENPCSQGKTYPAGTLLKAESDDFEIKTNAWNFNCGKALVTFETQSADGSPLPLKAVSSSFSGCSFAEGGGSCSVTASYGPSTLKWFEGGYYGHAMLVTNEASWVFSCGSVGGKWTFTLSPGFGVELTSTNETWQHPVAGFVYSSAPVLCGGTCEGLLSADFNISSPTPLYVARS